MDKEMQNSSLRIEHGPEGSAGGGLSKYLDDDGRQKRTGAYCESPLRRQESSALWVGSVCESDRNYNWLHHHCIY
ncbi:hypothetical protein OIU79_015711 [Salix purpurea]|uniref:Uncharacterized protein n=1 Tax=Salix purpurea TaxID=77065 RepID=A0A9Q0PCV1_SALPP|nr:hypothetical protein OIU79_015711 [Salix purpurea]